MQWPPRPGSGVEAHEAEGLGGGGVEHVPDVETEAVVDDLELVDEGDVDRAEDVFGELRGLGNAGRGDPHCRVDDLIVEGLGEVTGNWIDAAHDLGDVGRAEGRVAGVFTFGREGQEKVSSALESFEF
jgi:hypothetical protein